MDYRLRKRTRLRRKDIQALSEALSSSAGISMPFGEDANVEEAEGPEGRLVVFEGEIVAFYEGDQVFLTPRGLLRWPASKRYVTVDMGAVKFLSNGADVMGPGITDADPEIAEGDVVWVREERHGKPLAVGIALSGALVLRAKTKGKQVRTRFYVGDKAWTWGHEPE